MTPPPLKVPTTYTHSFISIPPSSLNTMTMGTPQTAKFHTTVSQTETHTTTDISSLALGLCSRHLLLSSLPLSSF